MLLLDRRSPVSSINDTGSPADAGEEKKCAKLKMTKLFSNGCQFQGRAAFVPIFDSIKKVEFYSHSGQRRRFIIQTFMFTAFISDGGNHGSK